MAHFVGPGVCGFAFLFLLIPLFWIALFGVVFAVVFAVTRRRRAAWFARGGGYGHPGFSGWHQGGNGGTHWSTLSRSAESTLAERFAQGDIGAPGSRYPRGGSTPLSALISQALM